MRIIARTAVLVMMCAALAGCSSGPAATKKSAAAPAAQANKPASAKKTMKLPEVAVPKATKPPKIVPAVEVPCKVVLSGYVKADLNGKAALDSNAEWHLNVTTGPMTGKGYNARVFVAFKGKPKPGDYTKKDVQTAQFSVVDKADPKRTWTFTGTQMGGSFKIALTSVTDKVAHGTIDASVPPVARVAPESSIVHMKVTF